jgi:hypothetical protein
VLKCEIDLQLKTAVLVENISGQRSDEIMILKKGSMQRDVSLLVFSTRLPLPESAYLSEIVIRVPVAQPHSEQFPNSCF